MAHESPHDRGKRMLREAGYADGGEVKPVPRKVGGNVNGRASESRPDRHARGGRVKPPVAIHIHTENPAKEQMAAQAGMKRGLQAGVALGARAAARKLTGVGTPPPGAPAGIAAAGPRPPMAPPPGGPVPGAGVMKDGGTVKVREHIRRKAGGRVPC